MLYGLKLHSTMTDSSTYILQDSKDEVEKVFEMFQDFLNEQNTDKWIDFIYHEDLVFCDEDVNQSFMVGELEADTYALYTDLGSDIETAYEFELVREYIDRF